MKQRQTLTNTHLLKYTLSHSPSLSHTPTHKHTPKRVKQQSKRVGVSQRKPGTFKSRSEQRISGWRNWHKPCLYGRLTTVTCPMLLFCFKKVSLVKWAILSRRVWQNLRSCEIKFLPDRTGCQHVDTMTPDDDRKDNNFDFEIKTPHHGFFCSNVRQLVSKQNFLSDKTSWETEEYKFYN